VYVDLGELLVESIEPVRLVLYDESACSVQALVSK
jgi:hypothetical protein